MELRRILSVAGVSLVLLFAVVWLSLTWQVFTFKETETNKGPIEVNTLVVVFAGFLATTVAATTAGWLGIEIRKPDQNGRRITENQVSWLRRARQVLSKLTVVTFSCYTFLGVGLLVTAIGLIKPDAAPQMYQAFMFSVVGWLAGAFAVAKVPPA
jgi:hypothetical protein